LRRQLNLTEIKISQSIVGNSIKPRNKKTSQLAEKVEKVVGGYQIREFGDYIQGTLLRLILILISKHILFLLLTSILLYYTLFLSFLSIQLYLY
jgi:hypothetical protein